MIWLKKSENQIYRELRLYAPKNEKIRLDFNPLRISDFPHWKPTWEDWHCYASPLRIYSQDYLLLLPYLNQLNSIRNSWNGAYHAFDVCFDNWIYQADWIWLLEAIKGDLKTADEKEKAFFFSFLEWIQEALQNTSVIVVEGNL